MAIRKRHPQPVHHRPRHWSNWVFYCRSLSLSIDRFLAVNVSWTAVGWGLVVDIVLSTIVLPLVPYFFGVREEDPAAFLWYLWLGSFAAACGGYITGRLDDPGQTDSMAIYCAVLVLLGIITSMFVPAPTWFALSAAVLTPLAAFGGGWLATQFRERRKAQTVVLTATEHVVMHDRRQVGITPKRGQQGI